MFDRIIFRVFSMFFHCLRMMGSSLPAVTVIDASTFTLEDGPRL